MTSLVGKDATANLWTTSRRSSESTTTHWRVGRISVRRVSVSLEVKVFTKIDGRKYRHFAIADIQGIP